MASNDAPTAVDLNQAQRSAITGAGPNSPAADTDNPTESPGAQAVAGTQQRAQSDKNSLAARLRQLLIHRPKLLILGWTLVALAFVLVLPVLYLSWYWGPVELWGWAGKQWWHWIPALFGFLFLFVIPIWAIMGASALAGYVADVSLALEDSAMEKVQTTVRETEDDAIRRLEQSDDAGLLPLLKYSRAQLDAYYEIGLKQTRGSFFNAVLAMWLGFLLLLVGIALYVGPVEQLGLTRPPQNFNVLILSGAAIVEFISALFLWVYRSTIAQLTYYYRLQMYNHTSILCFRMASTMNDADPTKQLIIEKILGWTQMPERPPVVGARGLRSLLAPTASGPSAPAASAQG
ncbi:MAG: hypothetical protein SV765_03895 [Pseudomonadota bacterium]|nr:hypothetical protein [Pseudomonadales bacterium]MDY6919338.1 hypothetical protein [Pseudomonadota bacterium]